MIIIRNLFIVLLLLTLAAISVVGIMVEAPPIANLTPDRTNALGRSVLAVMRPGNLLFFSWVVIFLACLLVFVLSILFPRKRLKIEVQMGGGRIVIMDQAIKKYIRNTLAGIKEITVKKIEMREHRGQIETNIYADVKATDNLPAQERRIISLVRSALAEDLGITNLGDVHVYVRNFEVTGTRTKTPVPDMEPERKPEPEVVMPAVAATAAAAAPVVNTTEDVTATTSEESAAAEMASRSVTQPAEDEPEEDLATLLARAPESDTPTADEDKISFPEEEAAGFVIPPSTAAQGVEKDWDLSGTTVADATETPQSDTEEEDKDKPAL